MFSQEIGLDYKAHIGEIQPTFIVRQMSGRKHVDPLIANCKHYNKVLHALLSQYLAIQECVVILRLIQIVGSQPCRTSLESRSTCTRSLTIKIRIRLAVYKIGEHRNNNLLMVDLHYVYVIILHSDQHLKYNNIIENLTQIRDNWSCVARLTFAWE